MKAGLRQLGNGLAAVALIYGVLFVCARARDLGLGLGIYIGTRFGFSAVGFVCVILMLLISYLGFVVGMSLARRKTS